MAKKTKVKKAETKPGPVVCFFFYGTIDQLGDQLAQAFMDAGLADVIRDLGSKFAPPQ
jgi:hypothetical protein